MAKSRIERARELYELRGRLTQLVQPSQHFVDLVDRELRELNLSEGERDELGIQSEAAKR